MRIKILFIILFIILLSPLANSVTDEKYFESRLNNLEKYIESRFNSIEKEKSTALTSMEKRLDGMNEFRASLKEQSTTFITRNEFNTLKDRVESDISEFKAFRAVIDSKASQSTATVSMILSVIGTLTGVASIVIILLKKKA